jgi:hypothetical protein
MQPAGCLHGGAVSSDFRRGTAAANIIFESAAAATMTTSFSHTISSPTLSSFVDHYIFIVCAISLH